MPIDCVTEGRAMQLKLEGEIDHHRAKQLMQELDRKLEQEMPRTVELDLGGITFMDSSGIALLLRLERFCAGMGGRLKVVRIPSQAGKVLRAAGLQTKLDLSFV